MNLDERVTRYITSCNEQRTAPRVSELAAQLGLTPLQLHRAYRSATGSRLSEVLKRAQVEIAKEMLRHSNQSVAQIARTVGCASEKTLYRLFRQHLGTTPGRFRTVEKNDSS